MVMQIRGSVITGNYRLQTPSPESHENCGIMEIRTQDSKLWAERQINLAIWPKATPRKMGLFCYYIIVTIFRTAKRWRYLQFGSVFYYLVRLMGSSGEEKKYPKMQLFTAAICFLDFSRFYLRMKHRIKVVFSFLIVMAPKLGLAETD